MISTKVKKIKLLTPEQIEIDKKYYEIIQQNKREEVSPKFEEWKNHYTYKIAEGGRGAGAKSWSATSLLAQKYHYSKVQLQCLCVREFMNSLAESSYNLIQKTINRLGYKDWAFTKEYIKNNRNGSYFIFRGLRDIKSAEQLKSYEGYDDLFADEASAIKLESWATVVPTLRKIDKEIWVLYNRDLDIDPCHEYFVINERPNTSYLHLEPGEIDNPWWFETSLPVDMEADYARDPDEAEHIWKGLPRKQGFKSAISRVLIRQAMDRVIEDPEGMEQIGVDVARYGDDATEMYRRKGMKTVDSNTVKGMDTNVNAYAIWDFAEHRSDIPIVIDIGYNPGVADRLIELGAYVIQVNFGGVAQDEDKYDSAASEMWFEFPVEEAQIPNDQQLMNELSGRLYEYDKKGRRIIESKKKFKERYKKSPDKADAILLTYYTAPLIGQGNVADYDASELGL
jgi:phage terminase large subunit